MKKPAGTGPADCHGADDENRRRHAKHVVLMALARGFDPRNSGH